MFTYKNKTTGAVITTYGKVTDANWVLVKNTKTKDASKDEKESDSE